MLNYESVGGVNFKKGCYPGREVPARGQFREQIKRRAFLVQGNVSLTSGQELFMPGDGQPGALVVSAAQVPLAGSGLIVWQAIASGELNAGESGELVSVLGVSATDLSSQPVAHQLLEDASGRAINRNHNTARPSPEYPY